MNPLEDEIRRLADRELEALPAESRVDGPDFTVSATGARVTQERDENGTLIRMHIGTGEPLTCVVYAEPNDAGGMLRTLVRSVAGKGSAARVIPGEVFVEGERPVQRLDVLYKARDPKGDAPSAGVLKLAWVGDFEHPALCYQDELGYARTFTDVARRVARTLVTPRAKRALQVEILRTTFGDVPVGFDYTSTWDDPADASRRKRTTYSLSSVPMGPSLEARDTVIAVTIDDRDRLQGGRWTVSVNGTLTQNLTLEKRATGFHVSGSSEGKPIEARLGGFGDGLPDIRVDAALAQRIAQPTPFDVQRRVYSPLVAADKVLEERAVHGDVPGQVVLEQGESKTHVTLDDRGHLTRLEVHRGEATMVSQLLFARDGETIRTPPLRN